ncbi:MAG: helix-turn-helix transcriptional regulator [Crocinitomicaceae bacterium]|nr:helix-turn-helix transcriptional regulator [Crocinitomicaceae bacterium]
MKSQNLNASEFADKINVKRSNLSHILSGRNKPSLDFLTKLLQVYPKVNAGWLILGEDSIGQYEVTKEQSPTPSIANHSQNENKVNPSIRNVLNESKTIDRVLIFFKDGTFKDYSPE